jgi:hypothetical protein
MIAANDNRCFVFGHCFIPDLHKLILRRDTLFFNFNYSPAFVSAAAGASMVRKPRFTALGASGQVRSCDFLVGSPFIPF